MNNFDFHNLLFPSEFELFCRDLLEIRENNMKFTTYRRGRDGGIDIKSTNTHFKVIGQCKLYNPNNYNSFFENLKKDVSKCKRQKPDRYIVCTNIELSSDKAEKIKELFKGYILNEEDIIDGIKLNKYLGQPAYEYLFKTYSKLLVPNFAAIEIALDQTIYRKYYNNTLSFLNDIKLKRNLFYSTTQIPDLIQKLEQNNVIVLSGNPGVGKTTTAKILANYFLSKKVKEVIFLGERDYVDAPSILKENQLMIIDDFWGQNFSPNIKNHSTYEREFQRFTSLFNNSKNNYLILTSREYIIKDILSVPERETEEILHYSKYIIDIAKLTFEDKLRIFLNHLLYNDFELSYLADLKYEDTLEFIIEHKNYSPRLIEQFIKIYRNTETQPSAHIFYKSFLEFLEKPLEFWKIVFNKLNPTSHLILFILLVSGDDLDIEDLKSSFLKMQVDARHLLNVNIVPADFHYELIKLEELYIAIDNNDYSENKIIKFQNPGIKDYLLEYLRTDGYLWIQPIISKAIFFNQLIFLFSTRDENINDNTDLYLDGKKIVLNKDLCLILQEKILKEFDNLNFSNYEEQDFSDQLSRYHGADETKYVKLIELSDLFDIELDENNNVRYFIVNHISEDFESFMRDRKFISTRSMIDFPKIIAKIFPFLNVTPQQILYTYYERIRFAAEYSYFYDFKEIFPLEFDVFYIENLSKIKTHIKELIYDEIDYYLCEDLDFEIDSLSYMIEDLSQQYKFRITKKIVEGWELASGRDFSHLLKQKEKTSKYKELPAANIFNKYRFKSFHSVIEEFLPVEENYNPKNFLLTNNYHFFLKQIKNENSLLYHFKNNQIIFETFCEYLVLNHIKVDEENSYNLINSYFAAFSKKLNIDISSLNNLFNDIRISLCQSDEYSLTKSKLNTILNSHNLCALQISELSPIIVPYKNWFKFSNDCFQLYFQAQYIAKLNDSSFFTKLGEALQEPAELRFLQYLEIMDKDRLWNTFIIPEFKRFLRSVDFTNEKTKILSFINFFHINFDLEWIPEENSFEVFSDSCSEYHYEQLFAFCNIDFSPMDLEYYFIGKKPYDCTPERIAINRKMMPILTAAVCKTVRPHATPYLFSHLPTTVYQIQLAQFINSNEHFSLFQNIGMNGYIDAKIKKIIEIVDDWAIGSEGSITGFCSEVGA